MKKIVFVSVCLLLFASFAIGSSISEERCRRSIESEFRDTSSSANIAIITVKEHDGIKGYSSGESGVIFEQKNDTYYALTAYHVVVNSDERLVLTTLDDTLSDYRKKNPNVGRVSTEDYYNQLHKAKIEYLCEESDLAIISFKYNGELDVASITDGKLTIGDNVVSVGTLEGDYFCVTYGNVISDKLLTFKVDDEQSKNQVMKHNAYIAPGSSGGAVYDSNMNIIGINIGGGTDIFGRFKYGAYIPADQIQECINTFHSVYK